MERLRELGAPSFIIGSIDRRLMPPGPRRGLVTYNLYGPELSAHRRETSQRLATAKPLTYEALQMSGLTRREVYERAGNGKETMRKALYARCGKRSAEAISDVLAIAAGLSDQERESVRQELLKPPREIL